MSLRGVFDAGRCAVGLHRWSAEVARPGSCVLVRRCERCGDVGERTEHRWQDWEEPDANCEQSRACSRCGETESRTEHAPGLPVYHGAGRCEQSLRCPRCGAWDADVVLNHVWRPWEYDERHHAPVRTCERCSLRMSAIAGHDVADRASDAPVMHDDQDAPIDAAVDGFMQLTRHKGAPAEQEPPEEPPAGPPESEPDNAALMERFQAEFAEQVSSGVITPERAAAQALILDELSQAIATGGQAGEGRIRELIQRQAPLVMDPSRAQPLPAAPPGSRAAMLGERLGAMHGLIFAEIASANLTGQTGEAVVAMTQHLREAREAIAETPGDGETTKLERELLRPLAREARRFCRREHLTFADPVWPSTPQTHDASTMFYSGSARVAELLTATCEPLGLRCLLADATGGREPAAERWDQLRQSDVGVFDLTGYARNMPLKRAAPVAAVTYELGIALTLGHAVVIVAGREQKLPFDVDVEPVRITGDTHADRSALAAGVEAVLYGVQRASDGSSVAASIEHLRRRFVAQSASPALFEVLDIFTADTAGDPIMARHLIDSAMSHLHEPVPELLLPSWPGAYPDPARPRCFHITSFGSECAATVKALQAACGESVEYVHPGDVEDPDIIGSIWHEICIATHVVCDLTGLNPNVALELGMAHALGRNVRVISQNARPEQGFRAIAKVRCHRYALKSEEGRQAFDESLRRFLAASGDAHAA